MFIHKVREHEVIFDSEADYDLVTCLGGRKPGRRKIYVDKSRKNKPYARVSFNGKDIRVHHLLVGMPQDGKMVDHFNGNSLDNRRNNLRHVTRSENGYNKPSQTNHRWITKQKNGRFQVCFRIGLGTFDTLEKARDKVRSFINQNEIKIYKDFYG
jgi:HNH endonuclease